jgi:RNA-dependent RNA polymerase
LGAKVNGEKVIEGDVIVTKNPCSHPGDVRKFKAVDIP